MPARRRERPPTGASCSTRSSNYRRAEKVEEAAKLLKTASLDPSVVANLDEWWLERRGLAYLALKANKPKLAYEIVRDAGPVSVNELNDQTFMAGWIALRYLKDVKQAEKHFADLVRTADGPLSRGRAHYWMGRTAEELGDTARAARQLPDGGARDRHLPRSPRHAEAFTGPPAFELSSRRRCPAPTSPPGFTNHGAAKAIALARKAGLGRTVTRVFLLNLAKIEKDEAWAAMAAHYARVTGDTQTAVRIGKAAIANGQNLIYYSYPVHALPKYTPLRPPPETAMLLGLARQETEFHSDTVSTAGAAGILQVMKVTANHICRDYKIKCTHARLLTDDSYNIMIASAYVADRMAEWQGSYVLALSSYNAGPGRTRQWIKEFGDPRTAAIDPIDWIERIPIEETRRYVAKVLSNIQIYRARLGEAATALRLDEDLNRARTASTPRAGRQRAQDEHGGLATTSRQTHFRARRPPAALRGARGQVRRWRPAKPSRTSTTHRAMDCGCMRAVMRRPAAAGAMRVPSSAYPVSRAMAATSTISPLPSAGARNTPRTIYTLDYRGRGLSDFDPDWRNYALPIEMLDVIDFITLERPAGRRTDRHLARRPDHHAAGGGPADRQWAPSC